MCGIVGLVRTAPLEGMTARIAAALAGLRPRGPDDAGIAFTEDAWSAIEVRRAELRDSAWSLPLPPEIETATTVLGHTRFSIVELSRLGAQPMLTEDGQICISFNGEIYNHNELRAELSARGHQFRSRSDTEVLLRAYVEWGERCFEHFVGWWAVAILDKRRNGVLLARDRIGKAPLYVRTGQGGVFWASEIASLIALTGPAQPAWDRIHTFVLSGLRDQFGGTAYEDIRTLEPGAYQWVQNGVLGPPTTYWRLPKTRMAEGEISVDEAARWVKQTLMEATETRLQADVPVALQLSGGLDSSVILACAAEAGRSVRAITASFPQVESNEDVYARAAAAWFGDAIEHEIINMDQEVPLGDVAGFTASMGEPFHSPNQIINRVIWKHLQSLGYRAVLYGAGGDEVFAGYYGQYFIPCLRSQLLKGDFREFASNWWNLSERSRNVADMLGRLAILLPRVPEAFDRSRRHIPANRRLYVGRPSSRLPGPAFGLENKLAALMGDMRMNYWLRVDNQNSMQAPIELRSPFLDHRVIEASFSLPVGYLVRDGWMKWIVRKAFEKSLPDSVVWRQVKMGFPFPLTHWLNRNASGITQMMESAGAPHIDMPALRNHLALNIHKDPERTWRTFSYALWFSQQVSRGGSLSATG